MTHHPERRAEARLEAADRAFRVLFVCQANQCRSPMAEQVLSSGLAESSRGDWQVRSAGTHARDGLPMHPMAQDTLDRAGIGTDLAGWRSSRLTGELLGWADVVLVADAANRRDVVMTAPAAVRKTFLLLDFARSAERAVDDLPFSGAVDLGAVDLCAVDSGAVDIGAVDSGSVDSGAVDSHSVDGDAPESSTADTEPGTAADAAVRHNGWQLTARASAGRRLVQPSLQGDDDLRDPIGHPPRAFAECLASEQRAIASLLRAARR